MCQRWQPIGTPASTLEGDTVIVDKDTGEQLYRNREFGFRIKFPQGWKVKSGDGPHVVQKASLDGASVLVLVNDVTKDGVSKARRATKEAALFSDAELREAIRSEMDGKKLALGDYPDPVESFGEKFSDVRVLAHELRALDNYPASFSKARISYQVHDKKVQAEIIVYQILRRGILYQVQGAAPISDMPQVEITILRSIGTFVFERLPE
jgi:hypothetical protein